MTAPVIETENLILRGHRREDLHALLTLWNDPEVVRRISGSPASEFEAWSRLLRYIGHWEAMGYGYWAVCLRETGAHIGDVGFAHYKREMSPPLGDAPEAGWLISADHSGRGLCSEAVRAMHAWADKARTWGQTVCLFDPANKASARLAEKMGYRFDYEAEFRNETVHVCRRSLA